MINFLLTLMKLRLNFLFIDLSQHFGICLDGNWKYAWFASFWDKKLGADGGRIRKYHIF